MVSKITTPLSISRALNYNEQKVQKGKAECLFAGNFLHQANELNFYQKLDRFEKLMEQNASKTNTLHISLNFHPSERLSNEKLIQIAESYMYKIGFGEQPFLVYRHFDAAHPHLHIVTTNICENGKRFDTYNIGRNQSQQARKEIEVEYGLMKAAGRKEQQKETPEAVNMQRLKYGFEETKRSMTNVLSLVINQYKFTSLAELNAVLKLYNVTADRGSEESRTFKNHGLHYRLLGEKGNKVGVPFKASSIYFKPTLKYLEEKFIANESLRLPFKSRLKTAIDWTLSKQPGSMNDFVSGMKKEKITAVVRENGQGFIYGITFIDHHSKTVFNGSDLGKPYSAAGIKERIAKSIQGEKNMATNLLEKKGRGSHPEKEIKQDGNQKQEAKSVNENLWDLLMNREKNDLRIPFDFIRKKKKRRKPRL
jgi:hypothetical protein